METALKDRRLAEHRDRLATVTQAQILAEQQRNALDGRLSGVKAKLRLTEESRPLGGA